MRSSWFDTLDGMANILRVAFSAESLLYFGVFSLCLAAIVIGSFLFYLYKLEERTTPLFGFFYLLAITFIPLPTIYYAFEAGLAVAPPRLPHLGSIKISEAPILDLERLDHRVKALRSTFDVLDKRAFGELKIGELKEILAQTLEVSEEIRSSTIQQYTLIANLRQQVQTEKAQAQEAKRLAETVKTLTEPQLEAVKFLITEDAAKQSQRSFVLGLLISFPIGVFASLLGTVVLRAFIKESSQKPKTDLRGLPAQTSGPPK